MYNVPLVFAVWTLALNAPVISTQIGGFVDLFPASKATIETNTRTQSSWHVFQDFSLPIAIQLSLAESIIQCTVHQHGFCSPLECNWLKVNKINKGALYDQVKVRLYGFPTAKVPISGLPMLSVLFLEPKRSCSLKHKGNQVRHKMHNCK